MATAALLVKNHLMKSVELGLPVLVQLDEDACNGYFTSHQSSAVSAKLLVAEMISSTSQYSFGL